MFSLPKVDNINVSKYLSSDSAGLHPLDITLAHTDLASRGIARQRGVTEEHLDMSSPESEVITRQELNDYVYKE